MEHTTARVRFQPELTMFLVRRRFLRHEQLHHSRRSWLRVLVRFFSRRSSTTELNHSDDSSRRVGYQLLGLEGIVFGIRTLVTDSLGMKSRLEFDGRRLDGDGKHDVFFSDRRHLTGWFNCRKLLVVDHSIFYRRIITNARDSRNQNQPCN